MSSNHNNIKSNVIIMYLVIIYRHEATIKTSAFLFNILAGDPSEGVIIINDSHLLPPSKGNSGDVRNSSASGSNVRSGGASPTSLGGSDITSRGYNNDLLLLSEYRSVFNQGILLIYIDGRERCSLPGNTTQTSGTSGMFGNLGTLTGLIFFCREFDLSVFFLHLT